MGVSRLLRFSDVLSAATVGGWLVGAAVALAAASWLWLALATALTPQDACLLPPPTLLPHRDSALLRTAEDTVARVKDIVRTLLQQISPGGSNSSSLSHFADHHVEKRSHQQRAGSVIDTNYPNRSVESDENYNSSGQHRPKTSDTDLKSQRRRRSASVIRNKISSAPLLKSFGWYIPYTEGKKTNPAVINPRLQRRCCTIRDDEIICALHFSRNSGTTRLTNIHGNAHRISDTSRLETMRALCCSTSSIKLKDSVWHDRRCSTLLQATERTHPHLSPRGTMVAETCHAYLSALNADALITAILLAENSPSGYLWIKIVESRKAQIPCVTLRRSAVVGDIHYLDVIAKQNGDDVNLQREAVSSNNAAHDSTAYESQRDMIVGCLFEICLKGRMSETHESLLNVLVHRLSNGGTRFSGKAVPHFTQDERHYICRKLTTYFNTRRHSRDTFLLPELVYKHSHVCQFKWNTPHENYMDYHSGNVHYFHFVLSSEDKLPQRLVQKYTLLKIINRFGSNKALQCCWKYNGESESKTIRNRVKRGARQRNGKNLQREVYSHVKRLFPRDSDETLAAAGDQTTDSEALLDDDVQSSHLNHSDSNYRLPETTTQESPSDVEESTYTSVNIVSDGLEVVTAPNTVKTEKEPEDERYTESLHADATDPIVHVTTSYLETDHTQVQSQLQVVNIDKESEDENNTESPHVDPTDHTEHVETLNFEMDHSQMQLQLPAEFESASETTPTPQERSTTGLAEIIPSTVSNTDEVTWWPPLVSVTPENNTSDTACHCEEPPSDPLVAAVLLLLGHVAPLLWSVAGRCGCGRWQLSAATLELLLWLPGLLGAASRAAGVQTPVRGPACRAATAAGLCGALLRVSQAVLSAARAPSSVRQGPRSPDSDPSSSGTRKTGWLSAEEAGPSNTVELPANPEAQDRGVTANETRIQEDSPKGEHSGRAADSGTQGAKLSPELEAVFVVGNTEPFPKPPTDSALEDETDDGSDKPTDHEDHEDNEYAGRHLQHDYSHSHCHGQN
ncbi:uncharacterized protein LOC126335705 [Schistocerca gregaria]|uniref:uncharacterized protein LOC126335705 n=1 Tax=Schistocerca gregaria TaxID=7010 RepID=UPI00211E1F12|nr:uncharacterized protein LOC126335705 [Schistocerca gregaria]